MGKFSLKITVADDPEKTGGYFPMPAICRKGVPAKIGEAAWTGGGLTVTNPPHLEKSFLNPHLK
jgi:hypothetical protein